MSAARPLRVDVGLAVVLGVFVVGCTAAVAHWHHAPLPPGAVAWLVAGAVPLVWRGTLPVVAFLASAVAVFSYYYSGFQGGPSLVLPVLALITLAYRRGPVLSGGLGALVAVCCVAATLIRGDPGGTLDPRLLGLVVWPAAAVVVGTMARMRREARGLSADRAAEAASRRAEEERLRIAREVHDVVAHSLAMINVQAGVAAHVADRRPEQAKAALLAIKDASRAALLDLRATLGVLRSGDDRTPTPGLERLPELIAAVAATGIEITAEGDAGPLPAPVDVAVYRILQANHHLVTYSRPAISVLAASHSYLRSTATSETVSAMTGTM